MRWLLKAGHELILGMRTPALHDKRWISPTSGFGTVAANKAPGGKKQQPADRSKAIALDPKYATAYDGRGEGWDKRGETQKAKADRESAAKLAGS